MVLRRKTVVIAVTALALVAALAGACSNSNVRKAGGDAETAEPAPVPRPGVDTTKAIFQPPIPYLSPEESKAHFHVPEGYQMERVLSEPHVREPVAVKFDGNGRMYVAEMRTYMQDIDGTGTERPTSRISVHWDADGDGTYDQHSVFVDSLVLPRSMLPLRDGSLLVTATYNNDVFTYTDTDGDHVADEKTLFYDGQDSDNNLEHQTSGLLWAADNWIYSTYRDRRLRWTPGDSVKTEPTGDDKGQWGMAQDNYGKPWFVNAGGEFGPVQFQQPIAYGAFSIEGELLPSTTAFRTVYPLAAVPDVQGGERRLRDNNTLNHFTGTAGQTIYRGDRLPQSLVGDLLFGEPVGRLIRRAEVSSREGVTYLKNAYDGAEFIRSTDPNFRPVNTATAPDGTLYIVDMYRGIIQEGNWVDEGSYLRKIVKKYGLADNTGRGRIWRLRHEAYEPGPLPNMYNESARRLVEHLAHPNGWWRDMAQRLLILRQAAAVTPALEQMARSHTNHLARFHAIWTLEGLGTFTPSLVRDKLEDKNPQVRIAAIRAAETLFKHGEVGTSLRQDILALRNDPDPNVVIQVMLTADRLEWPGAETMIKRTAAQSEARGVRAIARKLLGSDDVGGDHLQGRTAALYEQGREIYGDLCASCHGVDGRGAPMGGVEGQTLAPPLTGDSSLVRYRASFVKAVLHGVTGSINGRTYPGAMAAMEQHGDAWIAAVTTYVRNAFGNAHPPVTPEQVAKIRELTEGRSDPWPAEHLHSGAFKDQEQ